MIIPCRTIDEYRKMRAIVRDIPKRDRSKLKRDVKRNTLRALTDHASSFSFQARRTYRMLWHEASEVRDKKRLAQRAIHAAS